MKKREKKLTFLYRKLSRKIKRSRNRWKAKVKLSAEFEKLSNARKDFLHKLSNAFVNSYSLIAVENLDVKEMIGGGLGKSIQDASWSIFTNMLSYKAEEAGCQIMFVNPKNTSKECSKCGTFVEKRIWDRVHTCPDCGLVMG
ncbi:IS200/IS605 family element transposase accessory protein TnpB [Candidatus Micrarchaeota archaeon]|nr:IS200/IS605 family element transposase accessory protein TnpB [Candidatus Micrarchaeota archaeon]